MPLTIAGNLSIIRLAAGEPFVVRMSVDDGLDANERAFVMSVYGPGRAIQDTINAEQVGNYFEFVKNGAWSEGLYGKTGLKLEIAERLKGGRAILGTASLTIDISAQTVADYPNGATSRSAAMIEVSYSETGIVVISTQPIPYDDNVSTNPVFSVQPSIDPLTGSVGQTFTAIPGTVTNGSVTSRSWLLNGTSISTTLTAVPTVSGELTYQEFAGSTASGVQSAVVNAVDMKMGRIGYNSSLFFGDTPFINRVQGHMFYSVNGGGTMVYGANGYPVVPANGGVQSPINAMETEALIGANTVWVLKYAPTNLSITIDNITVDTDASIPGRTIFRYTGPGSPRLIINNPTGSASTMTKLAVMPVVEEAAWLNGSKISQRYIDTIKWASYYRAMETMETNIDHGTTNWASRPKLTDAHYERGMPVELVVEIANRANADLWFNVPVTATDDYVTQAAAYIRDNLNSGIGVFVEYANENWNFSTYVFAYTKAQAALPTNQGGYNDENKFGNWSGRRAAQVMTIFRTAFSATPLRLRCCAMAQTSPGYNVFFETFKAGVLEVAPAIWMLFDDLPIAPYISAGLEANTANDKATILSQARSGAAGVTWAVNQLAAGGGLEDTSQFSLGGLASAVSGFITLAQSNGLTPTCYEGCLMGVTAAAYASSPADQADIVDFVKRIAADPRLMALSSQYCDILRGAGIEANCVYQPIGAISKFGSFYDLPTIYSADTPRWSGLKTFQVTPTRAPAALSIYGGPPTVSAPFGNSAPAKYSASGGYAPYRFEIVNGTLPVGRSMDLRGVETGNYGTPGTYTYTLRVTDTTGAVATKIITKKVDADGPEVFAWDDNATAVGDIPTTGAGSSRIIDRGWINDWGYAKNGHVTYDFYLSYNKLNRFGAGINSANRKLEVTLDTTTWTRDYNSCSFYVFAPDSGDGGNPDLAVSIGKQADGSTYPANFVSIGRNDAFFQNIGVPPGYENLPITGKFTMTVIDGFLRIYIAGVEISQPGGYDVGTKFMPTQVVGMRSTLASGEGIGVDVPRYSRFALREL